MRIVALAGGQDHDAAGLPDGERRARVGAEVEVLDRDRVGPVARPSARRRGRGSSSAARPRPGPRASRSRRRRAPPGGRGHARRCRSRCWRRRGRCRGRSRARAEILACAPRTPLSSCRRQRGAREAEEPDREHDQRERRPRSSITWSSTPPRRLCGALGAHRAQPRRAPAVLVAAGEPAVQAVERAEALADDRHPDRQPDQHQQVRAGRRAARSPRSARRGRSARAARRSTSRPSRRPSSGRAARRPVTRASAASRSLHVPGFRCDNRRLCTASSLRRPISPRTWPACGPASRAAGRSSPTAAWTSCGAATELVVAGPATGPMPSDVPVGVPVFGVRFRLGVAGAALGLPAGEFLDGNVPVADVWGPAVDERVAAGGSPRWCRSCASALAGAPVDPLARAAALAMARPGARVDALCDLGRQRAPAAAALRRRRRLRAEDARAGPALPALPGAGGPGDDLARLAFAAGYADQAHLTRETRRLAGRTPLELVSRAPRRPVSAGWPPRPANGAG